jgi:hypothetical protein
VRQERTTVLLLGWRISWLLKICIRRGLGVAGEGWQVAWRHASLDQSEELVEYDELKLELDAVDEWVNCALEDC